MLEASLGGDDGHPIGRPPVYVSLALVPHAEFARRAGGPLIAEAERRGQHGMVERARAKAETTAATQPDTLEP